MNKNLSSKLRLTIIYEIIHYYNKINHYLLEKLRRIEEYLMKRWVSWICVKSGN